MTYDKLKEVYKEQYAVTGLDYANLIVMFHLTGCLWENVKKKDASVTIYDVIKKVIKAKVSTEEGFRVVYNLDLDYFFTPFSIQLEHMIEHQNFKPENLGLSNAKDIVDKINEIFDKWVPF